ncbi:unnamed protein product [Miscanthus lutarioriparius]|uniref:Uncharacterized protein n=1 Tax=Miscanthus lutarioriparius TaxID=422564 RepID=A0A811MH01_9POAL|nr:unnamed protein product [Miscanthus lutarioriparius]
MGQRHNLASSFCGLFKILVAFSYWMLRWKPYYVPFLVCLHEFCELFFTHDMAKVIYVDNHKHSLASMFSGTSQVATDLSAPVSSISLAIPAQSQHEDNSARCWISHENHLEEIFVHSKFPELRESADLSEVSDRCYGLTLAPGEQMIAVVRSLDLNLLNQMYQVRTQKAVVEFIWIGGQFVGIPLDRSIDICSPRSADLSSSNIMWWGSNILWSLKKYENVEKRLVLWDVVTALQESKKSAPAFLETLVHSWVSALSSGDLQRVSIKRELCI